MEVVLNKITVRDLTESYSDDMEDGVLGYGGQLNIRPPYQRAFVYKPEQREAVIDTVVNDLPLNVMYWADRSEERDDLLKGPRYEIIDGQQRTISIAQYVNNKFSRNGRQFHNLTDDEQEAILNYELMIYICKGKESETLSWFKTINIAALTLTEQELRNAVYSGPWLSQAKKYFSRRPKICPAYIFGGDYLKKSLRPERQECLETAIRWASKGQIEDYMSDHQHEDTAEHLCEHFRSVILWVKSVFKEYREEMKQVDWGPLYDQHKDDDLDPDGIEEEMQRLIADEEVTRLAGIYPYILTREEKHLSIRAFDERVKQRVYEEQDGICTICKNKFKIKDMQADHIKPWSQGGKTVEANCQVLCKPCNLAKGAAPAPNQPSPPPARVGPRPHPPISSDGDLAVY